MSEVLPRVATAVTVNEHDEVLVVRRTKHDVAENGDVLSLSLPGGKADPGERPIAAALRETLEETGCTVEPLEIIWQGRHLQFPIEMTYVACRLVGMSPTPPEDSGVAGILWIPRSRFAAEMPTQVNPAVQKYLDSYTA